MEMSISRLNFRSSLRAFFILLFGFSFSLAAVVDAQNASWEKLNKYGPSDRYSYGMAYDSANKLILIHGGRHGTGGELSDFWKWNGTKWTKILPTTSPGVRQEHDMAYDSNRKVVVFFGGWVSGWGNPYKNDTWEWNGKSWKQINKKGPSGRSKHAMVYDSKRKKIVLFGGTDGNERLGDTWTYSSKGWKKVATSGPPGLLLHSMVYDSKHDRVVLFGGYSDQGYNGDTWTWNGSKWTKVSQTGPSPRTSAAMAYYASAGVVILFGGTSGNWPDYVYYDDTWVWDGKEWAELEISGPSPRSDHRMVYNSKAKNVFLFGGDDPESWSALEDSWIFTYKK